MYNTHRVRGSTNGDDGSYGTIPNGGIEDAQAAPPVQNLLDRLANTFKHPQSVCNEYQNLADGLVGQCGTAEPEEKQNEPTCLVAELEAKVDALDKLATIIGNTNSRLACGFRLS